MTDHDETVRMVQSAIEADQEYVIELTRDIVRIPSVNPKFISDPEINREAEVQQRLESELRACGFQTEQWEVFPERPNLVGDLPGSEERSLILNGHVDVVPIGERSSWSVDPFGGEIKDGKIFGRGAVDMKGGVAACIAAARAITQAGIELEGRLSVHTVVDEEAGGFGAMDAVAKGKLASAAIVAEPTWGDVQIAQGGLEWVRVTLLGKSAHAGWRYNSMWPQAHTPDRLAPGVNAVELANRFLTALRDFEVSRCQRNYHPLLPPGIATINPAVIHAGAGLGEDGLPVVMTNPAIIPDVAVIDLDYKFMPNETSADVRAEFEAFVYHFAQADHWMREHPPKVSWELGGLHFPPLNTPVDHELVKSLIARKSETGRAPKVRGFEAVCDAAHYAGGGVNAAIFGPSGDGFHGDDECVEIDSLVETTKVIAASILDWCGTK